MNESSITATEGQNVTISCSVNGCQKSNIMWTKNGVDIGHQGAKLQLLSVTRADAGEYVCYSTFWNDFDKHAQMSLIVNCRY